jgi:hypothetical protein
MPIAAQHQVGRPLWAALAAAEAPATVEELRAAARASRTSVEHRLWLWERAGIVNRHQGRPVRYAMSDSVDRNQGAPSVSRDARVLVPKRPARARLWSAMRVLHTFDLPQLSLAAGGIGKGSQAFLTSLSKAGYLTQIRAADRTTGMPAIFRLAKNTGPKPPTISSVDLGGGEFARCVLDRNNGNRHILPSRSSRAPVDGGVS